MTSAIPMCAFCVRVREEDDLLACDAFPEGIPDSVLYGGLDHRLPVEGDHGLQFEGEMPDLMAESYDQQLSEGIVGRNDADHFYGPWNAGGGRGGGRGSSASSGPQKYRGLGKLGDAKLNAMAKTLNDQIDVKMGQWQTATHDGTVNSAKMKLAHELAALRLHRDRLARELRRRADLSALPGRDVRGLKDAVDLYKDDVRWNAARLQRGAHLDTGETPSLLASDQRRDQSVLGKLEAELAGRHLSQEPLLPGSDRWDYKPKTPEPAVVGKGSPKVLSTPIDEPSVQELGAAGINTTYVGKLASGETVYVKPWSGLTDGSMRENIPAGWDFKAELAAAEVNQRLGNMVNMPEVAVRDVYGLGPSLVATEVPGDTGVGFGIAKYFQAANSPSATAADKTALSAVNGRIKDMAIFDTVIGNSDRHSGNFTNDGDKYYAIDHGMSFPVVPGGTWGNRMANELVGGLPIDYEHRAALKSMLDQRADAEPVLTGLVGPEANTLVWQRIEKLLQDGFIPTDVELEEGTWP